MINNSSFGGSNLSEMEAKASILERNNFDLKMQVYYLNERLANNVGNESEKNSSPSDDSDDYHDYEYGKR